MNIDANFKTTIITAAVTIIVYFLNKMHERTKDERDKIRENKIPIYEEIVEFFFEVLMHESLHGKSMPEKKMLTFFSKINPKLVAWADDKVLRAFSDVRYCGIDSEGDGMEMLKRFQKLLIVIRKDLGHKSKDMDRSLAKLYLNDDVEKLFN